MQMAIGEGIEWQYAIFASIQIELAKK